ncbi:MAG: hypothetical protein M0R77_10595 [Gammaproteobacteria bacterium]|nr:hypothetical protein [Gammaproteobacteria bacterium]
MSFGNLLLKLDKLQTNDIGGTIEAVGQAYRTRPNLILKDMEVCHYINNLAWIKDPSLLMYTLAYNRRNSDQDGFKDFENRSILSLLGKFVENDDFWIEICFKYPEYAKFYRNPGYGFKTMMALLK